LGQLGLRSKGEPDAELVSPRANRKRQRRRPKVVVSLNFDPYCHD
jgi:hypothetical protein